MGVKIISRAYNEIYTDGETDWLLGNVGDWQRLRAIVEASIDFLATQQEPIQIDTINNAFVLSNGQGWGSYGFDAGMQINFSYKLLEDTNGDGNLNQESLVQQQLNILNIYGNVMEVDDLIISNGFENMPTNFGLKKITEVYFFVDQDPEGCRLNYAHLTNEDYQSTSLDSFIDGTTPEFVLPNLAGIIPGSWVNMEAVGLQSGMSIRSARVRKLSASDDGTYTSYNISPSPSLILQIIDTPFTDVDHDSARAIKCTLTQAQPGSQTVLVPNIIAQNNPAGNFANAPGNAVDAFIRNAPSNYTQQAFVNTTIKVTATQSLGSCGLELVLIRYTGGAAMNYSSHEVVRRWDNPQNLVNQPLNYSGILNMNISTGDSYILGVYLNHPGPHNNNSKFLSYQIVEGVIELSYPNQVLSLGAKRKYEFEINYMISPIFEELSNLTDLQPPSYLVGGGSLTDNIKFKFYPEWNNPNVEISNVLTNTQRLGNTGWFNENFNELDNNFAIQSVEYFDLNGAVAEGLDYSTPIKVKAIITGVPNLTALTECGVGFAWIPIDDGSYKQKNTPFHQNLFIQSGNLDDGFKLATPYVGPYVGAGINGGSMDLSDVSFTASSGTIVFEGTFTPTAQFFGLFDAKDENDRNYILWFSVANGNLIRNFSDRVSLLADVNQLTKNIPPAGPYDKIENAFIEHPFEEDSLGVEVYEGIVQDDLLCRLPFQFKKDGSEVFTKMTFGIEVSKIGSEQDFTLEKFDVDLTQYPTDNNGVPQINFDQVRGFKLNDGNNKNWVKIERNPGLDTETLAGYLGYYAFKIRWEDWIRNSSAPVDFFDVTQLNNGFHNDWVSYLRTSGWEINFFTELTGEVNGELLRYKNTFPFTFNDYDENVKLTTEHNYYRNSDNTLLNVGIEPISGRPLGVILSGEETRIEISFIIQDDGVFDILKTYGVVTIEVDKGPGILEQRQLSSVWQSESDNPLKPLSGQSFLTLALDGTGKILTLICIVNPDLLDDGAIYRVTGRVGCYEAQGTFDTGIYESAYETAYE